MQKHTNSKIPKNFLIKTLIFSLLIIIGFLLSFLAKVRLKSDSNRSIKIKKSSPKSITTTTNTDSISNFLTKDTSSILITKAVKKISITPIKTDADNVKITLQNKNLFRGNYVNGYLNYGKKNLHSTNSKDHRTTKWFPVLAQQGQSLVLSGTAHNRATWQFKTTEGMILTKVGTFQKYKEAKDVLQDKTCSKINIPANAVSARVYFANDRDHGTDALTNRLQIEYGKIPTNFEESFKKTVTLPSLKKGTRILWEDGKWLIEKQGKTMELNLESLPLQVGDTLSITTGSHCEVQVTWDVNSNTKYTGIYGVRWNRNESNPVCERVGDAKGLHFNAVEGNTPLTPYENDFDYIYPWSKIKVCAVKVLPDGRRNITYQGEQGFALDGSMGNVMIEIPKFYCKREIIDDYEYLWISPIKREGFSLDPSFVTATGEIEHIYIGAYLSSKKDKKLISASSTYPLIRHSLENLQNLEKNSEGFTECDLLSIMTIQRLYLVETAVLDSQSIFSGNVNMPYLLKDKTTSYYAVKSEKQTNRIYVKKTNMTLKFHSGDAISVLSSWNVYENSEEFQRDITAIHDMGNGTLEISFTGKPMDILQGETGITCIPAKNGETDRLLNMTGSVSPYSGQSSFKYRGIENLWGNVSILLSNAYVKNSYLYITYPDNKTVKISYELPIQNVQLSAKQFGAPTNMIVKRMGYDPYNPLIMFPCEIGNGALTSSFYCDSWYNLAKEDVPYILTYGGAWDNKGYAGVFNFRATFTKKDAIPFNGSRIMLR